MGARSIRMPDVGEGVAEAEIVEWSVKVGDLVREDQVVAAVMTDKATVEIPTPVAGAVVALGGAVGDVLAVGAELIRIEAPGLPDSPPPPPPQGGRKGRRGPSAGRRPRRRGPARRAKRRIEAPPSARRPLRRAASRPRPSAARRGRPARSRSLRRPCASGRARRASTCASCTGRDRRGGSPTTISTPISPAPRGAGEGAGAAAEPRRRDDQGRRHAPAHRPEHGRIVAPGRAFLLCRGGRRHRARGVARRAQRTRDGGAAEADDAALPDAGDRQGGRRLSAGQRALRRRQRGHRALRRGASRHCDPDAGRTDGPGGAPRRDAGPVRGRARNAPGQRGGAAGRRGARGAFRLDDHADLARRARRHRLDARSSTGRRWRSSASTRSW